MDGSYTNTSCDTGSACTPEKNADENMKKEELIVPPVAVMINNEPIMTVSSAPSAPSVMTSEGGREKTRPTLGICCMDAKAQSAPMKAIIRRLEKSFQIISLNEEIFNNKEVEDWPIVQCLISFHSDGFALSKAIEYTNLRAPIEINELRYQKILRHRNIVYDLLRTIEVPCPNAIVIDHSDKDIDFVESEDYILVSGVKICKPFVEKPVEADDHNIWIYYPRSAGGGIKKLFRKVGDKSSLYEQNAGKVRRDGKYMYEPFLSTQGTDIKVYTVGPGYFHAEARKAPTVDGKVNRSKDGKEIRYPIILSTEEKKYAAAIVQSFGQKICGFDILRTNKGVSYVCDVNGWSFVKGNQKYYNDCASLIRAFFLRALTEAESKTSAVSLSNIPSEIAMYEENLIEDNDDGTYEEVIKQTFADCDGEEQSAEGLKAVIVIMRHGDRKPKEKLKFKSSHPDILSYFEKDQKDEVVIKSVEQMWELLNRVKQILVSFNEDINTSSINSSQSVRGQNSRMSVLMQDKANMELVRDILMLHDKFTGINRKVQFKPLQWSRDGSVAQCRVVVKWGGEITKMGREQAEDLGRRLRLSLYPNDGLLRLHSTFRHDFKMYSSIEGRCQTTAAAFTKGFLDLEGELTPILTSLVTTSEAAKALLDEPIPREKRDSVKDHIDYLLHMTTNPAQDIQNKCTKDMEVQAERRGVNLASEFSRNLVPTNHPGLLKCARKIGNPFDALWRMMTLIDIYIVAVSEALASSVEDDDSDCSLSDEGTGAIGGLGRGAFQPPRGPGPRMPRNAFTAQEKKVALLRRLLHRWKKLFWGFVKLRKNVSKGNSPKNQKWSPTKEGVQKKTLCTTELKMIPAQGFCESEECTKEKVYFDTSKIPDVWDNIFYDLTHRREELEGIGCIKQAESIFDVVDSVNSWATVAEFGITKEDKLRIGVEVSYRLLTKLIGDLEFMFEQEKLCLDSENDIPQELAACRSVASNSTAPMASLTTATAEQLMNNLPTSQQHPSQNTLAVNTDDMVFPSLAPSPASSGVTVTTDSAPSSTTAPENPAASSTTATTTTNMKDTTVQATQNNGSKKTVVPARSGTNDSVEEDGGYDRKDREERGRSATSTQSPKREKKNKPPRFQWTSEEWHPVRVDDVKTESVRSRVYVTSASTMHSLLNTLCHAPGDMVDDGVLGDIVDLGYMSHIVMRCFQDDGPETDLSGYRIEVLVSEGVSITNDDGCVKWPTGSMVNNRSQQVAPLKRLCYVPLDHLHNVVSNILRAEENSGRDSDEG